MKTANQIMNVINILVLLVLLSFSVWENNMITQRNHTLNQDKMRLLKDSTKTHQMLNNCAESKRYDIVLDNLKLSH